MSRVARIKIEGKDNREAIMMAIKSMEQEPIYVNELIQKAYEDGKKDGQKEILEEIRAEIVELRSRQNIGVLECLDIIDKYRAESRK